MEKEVLIGVSARHVHLTKDAYEQLFDHDLTVKSPLYQTGEFAALETVTIKTEKGVFQNVRIIGPLRNYNQVEISRSDARKLGLFPPIRKSGDLQGASPITIATEKGEITVDACIIANRHVHMNEQDASSFGVKDGQMVTLAIDGEKSGQVDVAVKITANGKLEAHLDTDDANAFLLETGDKKKLII